MSQNMNPLRQMVLQGKAREDFFEWYHEIHEEYPKTVDLWLISRQLEFFTMFFKKTILNANDFYLAQEIYNKNISEG